MKTVIIANGSIEDPSFYGEILDEAELIIAADGGANHCESLGVIPHAIIGDFDSVTVENLAKYRDNSEIIHDPDQNKTDLQLALELAAEKKASSLTLIAVLGTRLDHTLANIFGLEQVTIPCRILDERNEIELVRDQIYLEGNKGDTISIIALSDVEGLSYAGLHWPLTEKAVKRGWSGICNKLEEEKASVSLKNGTILVMKTKD